MRANKVKTPKNINPDFCHLLRALRNSRHLTQEQMRVGLKYKKLDSYADFERGHRLPTMDVLLKIRQFLDLNDDEWSQLLALRTTSEASPLEIGALVLREYVGISSILHSLFERYDKQHGYIHKSDKEFVNRIADHREWSARVFRFPNTVPIVTGAMDNEHRAHYFTIPQPDRFAAERIQEYLKSIGITSTYTHCKDRNVVPEGHGEDIVLICGPAHNDMSAAINDLFQTEETWFRGFYFSQRFETSEKVVRPIGWSIRHREMPEVDIPFEELIHENPVTGGFTYRSSDTGYAHDLGLVYVGPNPHDAQHWLIMAAGLGPFATYGTAEALSEPAIVELLGRALYNNRRYCSCLVDYSFEPDDPYAGKITSIIATKGTVYSDI